MEDTLFQIATSQGVWAAMFIFLFVYQLRESKLIREDARGREDKLVTFITDMSKNFENLAAEYCRLATDVDYIKVEIIKAANKNGAS